MGSFDKVAPQNRSAEQAVLGACLIDNTALALISDKLTVEDFYVQKHALLFEAMLALHKKREAIDLITMGEYMREHAARFGDAVDTAYLAHLMNHTPTAVHAEHYASVVRNTARRRRLIEVAGRIAAASYEESDPEIAEDRASSMLLEVMSQANATGELLSPYDQGEVLRKLFLNKAKGDTTFIPTGFPKLDETAGGGLRRGDLVIVAARPSIGKSTYAECIAENVAESGKLVLFVSVEMSPEQCMHRFAVRTGTLSYSEINFGPRSKSELKRLDTLVEARNGLPMYILNSPAATTMNIRSAISRLEIRHGQVDLVVIDYLQLLNDNQRPGDKQMNDNSRVAAMTKQIKQMAREFRVPIILLSQLNRAMEHRDKKEREPKLADLRDSGAIEQDADLVLMLWEGEADAFGSVTRLKVAKNRQGATGHLPITFYKPGFAFSEPVQAPQAAAA